MNSNFRIACIIGILLIQPVLVSAVHTRTWHVHANVTTTDGEIGSWHTSGTSRLQTDDDGAGSDDRVCCLVISKGATQTGWTYVGGDDVIGSSAEQITCFNAMLRNSAALTSKYNGSPGSKYGTKIHIFGDPDCSTLVHEVGHIAGLGHVSVDKRFMTPSDDAALTSGVSGRKYVSESEKTSYETLE
ncbi:MAG: hypothetical protein ACYTFK_05820 [Planctomycetota bacterium]|jgi:hypothetical protein